MKYVFVGSSNVYNGAKIDYMKLCIQMTNHMLISLIDQIKGSNKSTYHFFNENAKQIRNSYFNKDSLLWIDSGGYSIITGDVTGDSVRSFIEAYNTALVGGFDIYDRIFSLDIPIFLNEPQYNTIDSIYYFNHLSISETLKLAENNPKYLDKWHFIWHFKLLDQWKIWNKIYDELELNNKIKKYSIGGMVGLRGATQINFSPFIGPMFKILYDYVTKNDFSTPLDIHTLGIYTVQDRFMLLLFEKLFSSYFNIAVNTTYDSINMMVSAQKLFRSLSVIDFSNSQLNFYDSPLNVPDEVIQKVYNTEQSYNGFYNEIDALNKNKKLSNINVFVPLSVYKHLQIDQILDHVITKLNLTEQICSVKKGSHNFSHQYHEIYTNFLARAHGLYPKIFTNKTCKNLQVSFQWLWKFHFWLRRCQASSFDDPKKSLNNLIEEFIKDINFPAELGKSNQVYQVNTNIFKQWNANDFIE